MYSQINYTYYANGLRQTMTVQGQSAVTYSYDNADRLSQIAQGTTNVGFTYDAIDRRATLTLPNGIVLSYGYDNASQVTSLTYQKDSTTLGTLTYSYDVSGRRTSMGGTFAQLNLPAAITSTAHDASNRLTNWGSHTLTYDDNGALISDADSSTLTYVWDERQRLKEIKQGTTVVGSFQYDAFNRRVGKTIGGTSSNFLHDGWQIVQELNGTTPTANLLTGLGLDSVFRRTAGSSIEDFLTDALGSTIALTDSAGAIQTTFAYEPYGGTTTSGNTSTSSYQYTGRESDGGLYYYRNRYYSPVAQRFVSEDPIGLAGGQNVYAYAGGNPISYRDPLGLFLTSVDAACFVDLQFCAEIMGQIVENHGVLTCNEAEANRVANGLRKAGTVANVLLIVGVVRSAAAKGLGKAPEFFGGRASESEFLNAAEKWLGPGYNHCQTADTFRPTGCDRCAMGDTRPGA